VTDTTTTAQPGAAAEGRTDNAMWSGRLAFILAATGSAVGLGNIWKFPYITGENGGAAFVLVYLLCIALIGLPIMIAEVTLGRAGRRSPINTMKMLASRDGNSPNWKFLGWMGMIASFLILSFYSVIGGWSLAYVGNAASGSFNGSDADSIGALFGGLLGSPGTLMMWHSIFMVLVIMIVARGISSGLEKAINILMPILFFLLLVMVGYAMATDEFTRGFSFLFSPDFSKLTTESVLSALGHAFFTLSLGMGVMMAYGSFLPKNVSIVKTAVTVSVVDTVVALAAGLAIFPLVFANGLEPGAGPGLIFQTLPLAFGQMPFGTLFGTLFFGLLLVAAVTSAISMLEPVVEWLEERQNMSRLSGAIAGGLAIWVLGIATVLSFNEWSGFHPLSFLPAFEGKTVFDILDYVTANLMMPLGGLLIAAYMGWFMKREAVESELDLNNPVLFNALMFVMRFVTPALVMVVFLYNLF